MTESRKRANDAAIVAFILVLIAGIVVIAGHNPVDRPTTTTVVTKSAVAPSTSSQRATQVGGGAKGKKTRTTTTTTTSTPGTPASTETTSVTGGRSFFERLLGHDGVVFLQLGIALLAAFVAAAAVQRVMLGHYGGIKFGTLELGEIADATVEEGKKLEASIAKLQTELSDAVKALDGQMKLESARSSRLDSELSSELAQVMRNLKAVEKQKKAKK